MTSAQNNIIKNEILIVEDDKFSLRTLSTILLAQGYDVRGVADGAAALISVGIQQPDLILLDIQLPELNGFDVCRHLKRDAATKDIPVIFLSALDEVIDKVKGFDAGGVDYITKPFQVEEVIARVHTHLSIRRLQMQLKNQNSELQKRIYERNRAESALQQINNELEQRVQMRTAELSQLNAALMDEIEERKRAEFETLQAKKQLEATLFALPDLLFELDDQGVIHTYHFPDFEWQFDHSIQEHHTNIIDLLPQNAAHAMMNAVAQAGENGRYTGSHFSLKQGNQIKWFEISIAAKEMKNGGNGRFITLIRDITDRKHLEEQLRQSQKMEAIGRLAGGVAHDFNNLLSVIISYGELLLRQHEEISPSARKQIEQIIQSGNRAANLTTQLLAFSRQQVLEPNIININDILTNIAKLLIRVIGEDIELILALADDLQFVRVDRTQIEQVVLNLVVNARDAMPQGGKITLETANVYLDSDHYQQRPHIQPGNYIMLAVSDNGHGMDEETQSHIFEPFFTTKEKGRGTGLGLATVHGIVNQSGGHIWVNSELNQGTTFKIYFPQTKEDLSHPKKQHAAISTTAGTETVLLVEDDRIVRRLANHILTLYGYNTLVAKDTNHAQTICKEYAGEIQLMLTDVVMPVISGGELAQQLQKIRPTMKVLYMSGYTDNVIVHHGVLKANTAFLQKPFTPDSLTAKVRETIDSE